MNIEVRTIYPSHDRIVVLEIHLQSKSPMLYKPALHGNWNALSLTRRALKEKFPAPVVPLTAVLPNRQVFLPDPVWSSNEVRSIRPQVTYLLHLLTPVTVEENVNSVISQLLAMNALSDSRQLQHLLEMENREEQQLLNVAQAKYQSYQRKDVISEYCSGLLTYLLTHLLHGAESFLRS